MAIFEVKGGQRLQGEITPQGAKNEALQVISAVLLTAEPVTITNIPDILDVNNLIELLEEMNVKVERPDRQTCTFTAADVNLDYFRSDAFKSKSGRLRGSVMLAGPMLARYKKHLCRNLVVTRSVGAGWIHTSSVLKNWVRNGPMSPVTDFIT